MTLFSAFVSFLGLTSIKNSGETTVVKSAHMNYENPTCSRASMLQCDKDGKCPDGSTCVKLIGKYGVCVVDAK